MIRFLGTIAKKIYASIDMHIGFVFFVLFFALFFGDGKQSFVDLFVSCSLLLLFVFTGLWKKKNAVYAPSLSVRCIWLSWGAVMCYLFVRMFWSDSIAYSLLTVNRFLIGFLIYWYFVSLRHMPHIREKFVQTLFYFIFVALICSCIVLLFPRIGSTLPLMNLLYPNYGHNYLSYLLIFWIPIVFQNFVDRPSWKTGVFLCLGIGYTFLTFARGLWILIGVYTVYFIFVRRKELSDRMRNIFFGVACLFFCFFFGLFGIRGVHFNTYYASTLQKYILKQSIFEDRLNYWHQAIDAITYRPLFGSGPGTFFLESLRFQKVEGAYSWYAHSFILQTVTEAGCVGGTIVFLLLGSVIFVSYKAEKKKKVPDLMFHRMIFEGCILTLLYSVYDYNLDFFIVWILLWAGFGMLTPSEQMTDEKKLKGYTLWIGMGMSWVAMIFILSFLDFFVFFVTPVRMTPPFFLPINGLTTTAYLKRTVDAQRPISPIQTSFIHFFHRNDPQILDFLGDARITLRYDPLNTVYMQKVLAEDVQDTHVLAQYMSDYTFRIYKRLSADEQMHMEQDIAACIAPDDKKQLVSFIGTPDTAQEFLSKFYYYLGYSCLTIDPSKTRTYWTYARDISSGWGYFHVELARLEYIYFNNTDGAKQILSDCLLYPSAFGQCHEIVLDDFIRDDQTQYTNIQNIPNL